MTRRSETYQEADTGVGHTASGKSFIKAICKTDFVRKMVDEAKAPVRQRLQLGF